MKISKLLPILQYIGSLELNELNALYSDLYTTITIFRTLSSLAQQYILRILWFNHSVKKELFTRWSNDINNPSEHKDIMELLYYLKILLANPKDDSTLLLNSAFATSLKQASCNEANENKIKASTKVDVKLPALNHLKEYADLEWQKMLHFMVASGETDDNTELKNQIHPNVISIITRMKLMQLV